MITKEDIIKWSKPHLMKGGRRTQIENDKIILSIVGGCQGLYGDFDKNFEIAIMDKDTSKFVTKYFVTDASDDVLSYYSDEDTANLANKLFSGGFRVVQ